MEKKITKDKLVALRMDHKLIDQISGVGVSSFIREAIEEKLKRDKELKICPKCKGSGYVRR